MAELFDELRPRAFAVAYRILSDLLTPLSPGPPPQGPDQVAVAASETELRMRAGDCRAWVSRDEDRSGIKWKGIIDDIGQQLDENDH